jgi:cell wall-associated NlpC family hydrolase
VEEFEVEKSENAELEEVIEEGYKQLGVPYVYGAVRLHDGKGNLLSGFTKSKFDCSSLVQYMFYQGAGVLLQTTTRTQVVQGKYVAKSELKRGDCIYFTNSSRQYNTGIERIGHVAVYLGDGYILHTSSDYARIEKMSSTRWGYYIEARRFL